MAICPRCGADGATITHLSAYRGDLQSEIYCNSCQQTSTVPEYLKWMLEPKSGRVREPHKGYDGLAVKKEEPTVRVSYNGFTGLLRKLEWHNMSHTIGEAYTLEIWDDEKRVKHTFECVKLSDVKFLGGAVLFGG